MDAFVLAASVAELHGLVGAFVERVSQPSPRSLLLEFRRERKKKVLLSAEPSSPRLHLIERLPPPSAATPFGALAERHLRGKRLQGITRQGLERVVAFRFGGKAQEEGVILYAELMGRDSNLILAEGSGEILASLRSRPGLTDHYGPPPKPDKPDLSELDSFPTFRELISPRLESGDEAWRVLVEAFLGLSPLVAREIAFRARALEGMERVERLWTALQEILTIVRMALFQPRILQDDEKTPLALAAFPFCSLPEEQQVAFPTMAEAAERFYEWKTTQQGLVALRRTLLQRVKALEERLLRRVAKLNEEASVYAKAEVHKTMGQLLLANQRSVTKGMTEVRLRDYSGEPLTIPLDPALPVRANAEAYFRLFRKAKRGIEMVRRRLLETEKTLGRLKGLREQVHTAKERETLSALERAFPSRPSARPGREIFQKEKGKGPLPRQFVSSDGLTILVGRSGSGNESLTWKLAKPHDLWLHAQGVPGSHVLVRLPGKDASLPPRTLREAAVLAAYYSQARGQGKVEVAYTFRKYLKRPKGAKPGTVLLTHEKTILVSPDPELVRKLAVPSSTLQTPDPRLEVVSRGMPIFAAIDVGTNTIRLLVAEADAPGAFRLIFEEQAITRLGEDLLRTGSLKEEAMARTTAVLRRYAEIAREYRAEAVQAVATSAVREAMNGEDFSAKVLEETGLTLQIIPSEEEARLAIFGVSHALGFPKENLLVLDVGGGSAEFALARDLQPKAVISTDLGVVKLTEGFLKSDPPTLEALQALTEAIRRRIKGVRTRLPDLQGALLVGTGGTATTLAAIHLKLVAYDPEKVNGVSLSLEQVEGVFESLAAMSHQERLQVPGLEPGREDLIVAGTAVILETLRGLSFPSLLVSDGGLREGVLLDLLERRFRPPA